MNDKERRCDDCGGTPAYPSYGTADVCPTDRGDEIRNDWIYLCDECYEKGKIA